LINNFFSIFYCFEDIRLPRKKSVFFFQGGFHPLNMNLGMYKKNTCLLNFCVLQHISRRIKSASDNCDSSLVSVLDSPHSLLTQRIFPSNHSFDFSLVLFLCLLSQKATSSNFPCEFYDFEREIYQWILLIPDFIIIIILILHMNYPISSMHWSSFPQFRLDDFDLAEIRHVVVIQDPDAILIPVFLSDFLYPYEILICFFYNLFPLQRLP